MELELYYPAKPYRVNQKWGVHRPEVYSQFGFSRHNGIDIALGIDGKVRAELPCEVYRVGHQPNGGGFYMTVISRSTYHDKDGRQGWVMIDYLHLERFIAKVGDKLEVGDVLAIGDNTGFSTGPHTHCQYRWIHKTTTGFTELDQNDANNSFDPEPYYNGKYAEDRKAGTSWSDRLLANPQAWASLFGASTSVVRSFALILKSIGL